MSPQTLIFWEYGCPNRADAIALRSQGKRILILHLGQTSQDLKQVILLPTRQEAFTLDAPFAGFLLFEQVQSDMPQQGEVFWSMVFADPAAVFIKGKIQGPV
jgi:hypothetical protein